MGDSGVGIRLGRARPNEIALGHALPLRTQIIRTTGSSEDLYGACSRQGAHETGALARFDRPVRVGARVQCSTRVRTKLAPPLSLASRVSNDVFRRVRRRGHARSARALLRRV
jgi:hypothetical protein